jgi:hypothetical protein
VNTAAALPSVSEVLTRLLEGQCTPEQAEAWIADHVRLAQNTEPPPVVTVNLPAVDRLVELLERMT